MILNIPEQPFPMKIIKVLFRWTLKYSLAFPSLAEKMRKIPPGKISGGGSVKDLKLRLPA